MKFKELCQKLHSEKVKVIYLIHEEKIGFTQNLDINRFADKLRANRFIPLIARDFRPLGEEFVSRAIEVSQYALVIAFEEETVKKCKAKGVPFVVVEEALA